MKLRSPGGAAFLRAAVFFTPSLVRAHQCAEGQSWCQDRCGTDADTCCDTPDGQHNLCGPGTICCGFGCCPDSSYTCNADFSCTGPDGVVIPPAQPNHPVPTITTGDGSGGSDASPASTSTGTVVIIDTQTVTLPAVTTLTTVTTLDHTITLTPSANTDPTEPHPTVVIVGTNTATLPHITKPTTVVTIGTTLTLLPPSLSTAPLPTDTSGPGESPESPIVVIDGTRTLSLSPVTTPTTVTTDGQAITLVPNGPPTITVGKPPAVTTNTGDPEQSPPGPVVVIDGTKTTTFPHVTTSTKVTNDGQTFTLVPNGPPTITVGNPPIATSTGDPGDPTSPVVIIDGTKTATFSPVTAPTTVTTDGQIFTLVPNGAPVITVGKPPLPTTQTGNPSVVVIIGTQSITFPPVAQQTTVTTEGQTITLVPQGPSTITANLPPPTQTTGTTAQTEGSLPTFTEWPPEASITPVSQEVEAPEPEDDNDDGDPDGAVVSCKLWFFSICIELPSINILGWKFNLPPGVYPPGAPPIPRIKFPPGISFRGELPPWPKFTIGPDHVPTFSEKPDPTDCETKTASLCFETTSFIVSTVDGAVQTVSSTVPPPQCGEVRGCAVMDVTETASATKTDDCETATATDVVITCSGSGATACSTKTEIPKTGCSVTATTTTESCIPAPTDGNVRRQEGDNFCPLAVEYLVWPHDGTKTDETDVIYAEMRKLLQDESKIEVADTKTMGIDFWRVTLEPEQAEKVKEISNVAAVYQPCTDCGDPSTATNWRYQDKYVDEVAEELLIVSGHDQMVYLSQNQQFDEDLGQEYYFDVSAGEDVPVYIVDTGAQIDHREFDYIRDKTEFIFVRDDYDGKQTKDDSGAPLGGKCVGKCKPHGTTMLSLVAGKRLGIAKKVKPYLVRMPRMKKSGRGAGPEYWLRGVSIVGDQFTDNSETVRAIINLSFHYSLEKFQGGQPGATEEAYDVWTRRLNAHITSLIQKGVFVVTGSGNGEFRGYPALFGGMGLQLQIPEILVVGAVRANGNAWIQSYMNPGLQIPHISAPGERVVAAQGDKAKWEKSRFLNKPEGTYKISDGTSDASAYAAGLAAYFVKLHQLGRLPKDAGGNDPDMSPAGLKQYILNNGWPRVSPQGQGPLGIWNGATIRQIKDDGYCPYNLKKGMKKFKVRQEEDPDDNDDISASATCKPGESPTGIPTTTDDPTEPSATGIACTPETAGQCAPAMICSAPRRNGCQDGKCVCILPDPTTFSTVTRTTEESNPTGFTCTSETADQCAPALICSAPRRNGCKDGKCVCLLPDPPTTTEPESPAPTCDDKCKLDAGNPCNCDENGCDEQSPSCCSTGNCPKCECGENGCSDDSPDCCASGTCQWLDGGEEPPEVPEPTKGFVLLAFSELYIPSLVGGSTWTREWLVFGASPDASIDVCDDQSITSEESNTGTGSDPGFPPSVSSFEAEGVACSYEGDEDKLGTLVCDGVRRECKEYDEDSVSCGPAGTPRVQWVVGCSF
ncbi:hypothetical protein FQN54_009982 [Arachnomyces sp. PD_36]|nr:hypothetical protein FQN54_009982 [Arachnomyces sp. PD_36]